MARWQARGLRNMLVPVSSGDTGRDFTASSGLDTITPPAPEVQCCLKLSGTILLASLSALFGLQIALIIQATGLSDSFQRAGTLVSATAAFALQLRNSWPAAQRWTARERGAMVLTQAAATYLPLLAFGIIWMGVTGFLAGSVLLLIPGWKAWVPFTAIALSMLAAAIMMRSEAY